MAAAAALRPCPCTVSSLSVRETKFSDLDLVFGSSTYCGLIPAKTASPGLFFGQVLSVVGRADVWDALGKAVSTETTEI